LWQWLVFRCGSDCGETGSFIQYVWQRVQILYSTWMLQSESFECLQKQGGKAICNFSESAFLSAPRDLKIRKEVR
jgi:hypothetical protein